MLEGKKSYALTQLYIFMLQASGLSVVADKLNFYRYLSHFRCVHRGAFFAEMRTTAVRKFLPEAWGKCNYSKCNGCICVIWHKLVGKIK